MGVKKGYLNGGGVLNKKTLEREGIKNKDT